MLRRSFNDVLFKYGGHIAYSIRPTERKKGYGSEILKLALNEYKNMGVKRVLVTCKKGNIGSIKVILNNGGVFENKVLSKKEVIFFKILDKHCRRKMSIVQ